MIGIKLLSGLDVDVDVLPLEAGLLEHDHDLLPIRRGHRMQFDHRVLLAESAWRQSKDRRLLYCKCSPDADSGARPKATSRYLLAMGIAATSATQRLGHARSAAFGSYAGTRARRVLPSKKYRSSALATRTGARRG